MDDGERMKQGHDTASGRISPALILVGTGLGVVSATLGASILLSPLSVAVGAWFTEIFVFLGLPWVLLQMSGRHPKVATGLRWPGWRPVLVGATLGASTLLAFGMPVLWLWRQLFSKELQALFDQSKLFEQTERWETGLIVLSVSLAAPFCEEYLFRGVVQNFLRRWKLDAPRAIGVTALLFALFHFNPVVLPALVLLGVLFGVLSAWTGSLWPAIAAHAANNILSTALFFSAEKSAPELSLREVAQELAGVATIGLAVFALVMVLVRRDPRWLPRGQMPADPVLPPLPLLRAARPWLLAAAGMLLLALVADRRAVAIRAVDLRNPRPREMKTEPAALEALRREAREGGLSVDEYRTRRRALLESEGKRTDEREPSSLTHCAGASRTDTRPVTECAKRRPP